VGLSAGDGRPSGREGGGPKPGLVAETGTVGLFGPRQTNSRDGFAGLVWARKGEGDSFFTLFFFYVKAISKPNQSTF